MRVPGAGGAVAGRADFDDAQPVSRQRADRETESQRAIPPRQSVHDRLAARGRDL